MFIVDTRQPAPIEIGAIGIRAKLQQVRMVMTTIKGSVPLDRTFGLRMTFLDRPLPHAMAEFSGEIISEVQAQVPGVTVVDVDFKPDESGAMDGRLYPVTSVNIEEDA